MFVIPLSPFWIRHVDPDRPAFGLVDMDLQSLGLCSKCVFHQVWYEMLISSGGDRITENVEPIKDEFANCIVYYLAFRKSKVAFVHFTKTN